MLTAPKSASASSSTRVRPATQAGRAIGSAARKKAATGPWPSERAASMAALPWRRKAARTTRKTYG
ncbi:MAG: hypothetical protein A2X76_08300 [Lysobacterales bacterium GWF1_69_6]|nr:MAG: hypothetical protein A2X76_08300 [Xanthomonadales bacterium GWF1_69_6]